MIIGVGIIIISVKIFLVLEDFSLFVVKDVYEGNGKDVRFFGVSKVGNVSVEWDILLNC